MRKSLIFLAVAGGIVVVVAVLWMGGAFVGSRLSSATGGQYELAEEGLAVGEAAPSFGAPAGGVFAQKSAMADSAVERAPIDRTVPSQTTERLIIKSATVSGVVDNV